MMRRILAFALACLLAAPAFAFEAIDGDTLRHGGRSYRIVGLDTPELFSPRCRAERLLALQAKRRLQGLLESGVINLGVLPNKDKYGRGLAVVLVGGIDVAETLVREGYAVPYVCPKNRCPRRINWCE